ncbi:aminotransferase-like domain-containing protein [Dyella soli]|uniref:aminotransferase-like domain-containing protein n=1 Tax=Dyella soli TaxID=522319 RepID=UPI001F0E1E1E|nr:PLP-dependent aminotransferase family protein [Dyella soli]
MLRFLERAIAEDRLRPGDRLPPQRQLAKQLGLDLTTITRAFAEATARKLIHARGTLGTFVSMPEVELSPIIDLSMNIPPLPVQVDFGDLLRRGMAQVLTYADVDNLMNYQLNGGGRSERTAGSRWLAPMLGKVDSTRIAVTAGAQAALSALILTLSAPGDHILADAMTYPGLLAAASELGRLVTAVEGDEYGMDPEALASMCRTQGGKLLYLNPTLHNPTTITMPGQRRQAIARVAAQYDLQVIEDDPYWLLAEAPPAPVACLAPDRVHYIATLSKCLAPGLRTAYVVSPSDRWQGRLLTALRATTLMHAPLATAVATQWIHDGSATQLLDGIKSEVRARQELAMQVLPHRGQPWPSGSIHLWYELPGSWTPSALAVAARMEGLAVTPSEAFAVTPGSGQAIRISLGGVRDRPRLRLAIQKLAGLLEQSPGSATSVHV